MATLQSLAQSYLKSADFNLIDIREDFVIADKLGIGGDRDTRLLWTLPPPVSISDFSKLEQRLLREFKAISPKYPNARYYIIVHTREGFSRDFRSELSKLHIRMRTTIEFFDAPFRTDPREEDKEVREVARHFVSAITPLRNLDTLRKRVPQPYSILVDGEPREKGDDLLLHLLNELRGYEITSPKTACLRIVIGAAGVGKSVLCQALFALLYKHFLDEKERRQIFPRPIPLLPSYLRDAITLRIQALIDCFIRTELAAQIPLETFKWMLVNGFSMWLFDGLDELYAGDPDFFEALLDLLTQPGSQAQVIICARDSLLRTSETFANFLDEFPPGAKDAAVCVYQLNDWEYASKRTFAWLNLEGRRPKKREIDPPRVSQFLKVISESESLKLLSSLPYYCVLLLEEFKEGTLTEFSDNFALIEQTVSRIIQREEEEKKLLAPEQFEREGLTDWLETVALEFYEGDFKGLTETDVEEYAGLVLSEGLLPDELRKALTALKQFPLFAPGVKLGVITFKHELVAEYLAGRYLLKRIVENPDWVAKSLGARIDFSDSLIARYMASRLAGLNGGIQAVVNALKAGRLMGRNFANLLQLFLLSTPARDVIKANVIELDGKNLRYVQFRDKDLKEVSFRNCDLSNASFKACDLQKALFEGAILSGTKFEQLSEEALREARFGNLERFESIYVEKKRIEEHNKMIEWVQRTTGLIEKIHEPCPASLQLKTLFLKFVYADGSGRRDELLESALSRGKRYPGAPSPDDCIRACLRFGYLQGPDQRKRIKRTPGDLYTQIVYFVKDWRLSTEMRQLLNSLCKKSGCEHVPRLR